MKKNIAVVSGGFSKESDVSAESTATLMTNIDAKKYVPFRVNIGETIWTAEWNGEKFPIDKNDFSFHDKGKRIHFDCVFIAIHGTPGEDGKLQGYFDMLDIPYTGCSAITSAVTFDKYYCNQLVRYWGVDASNGIVLGCDSSYDVSEIVKKIGLPCFVKPNKGGSSIGISKIKEEDKLEEAIKIAFKEDDEVIIEAHVEGREITCGVFKNGKEIIALPLTEVIPKREFFDYHDKYAGIDGAQEITPADLPEKMAEDIKSISIQLYSLMRCDGMVRIDYILKPDNGLYFLEVNTVPGLSKTSIVPQQAVEYGYSLKEFFSIIIEDALYRGRRRKTCRK